ncbi:MAG: oleate hydratase [Streptosporangiaceae bacterium]|jgi:oleate hydratase|nr:oleate hydratase [Streptosporangiaceae bacterium]MDX6428967.1 oleate hydratase [Streptosporangiaceae bacterium]
MSMVGTTAKAYIVGGGIASLAAAVFLVRDGGLKGADIRILEELPVAGGALDGSGDPEHGYVTRGGRMFEEEAYGCLCDLLETIPTLTDPATSVLADIREFNSTWKTHARARLIDEKHTLVDAADLGFTVRDRAELTRLMALPERSIGSRRIDEFFSPHFFETNFWAMWRTTFAFQTWSSAIELKRYFLRFAQEFPRIHTLGGVRRTRLNQYDSIVRPIQSWLADQGVVTEYGTKVTDVDFTSAGADRRAIRIHLERDGRHSAYELGPDDLAFITLGSMTSDSAYGDDDHAPGLIRGKRDGGFALWECIAGRAPDFGRPMSFAGNVEESKWESFTLTMRSPLLLHRIEEFSGNAPGTGALMTFVDSRWLMSIVVPHQPHFDGQPDDVFTLWGYGLFVDEPGDFIEKRMSEATGQELLTELVHHLGFEDDLGEISATTTVIPVMMPYVTSAFQPRGVEDRPLVVPRGSKNFAFLGQYTEIPQDVVFTVEYSVRGAMHGVYALLSIDRPIPGIYHAITDPRVAFGALKKALS